MLHNRKQVKEYFEIDTSTLRVWIEKGIPFEEKMVLSISMSRLLKIG